MKIIGFNKTNGQKPIPVVDLSKKEEEMGKTECIAEYKIQFRKQFSWFGLRPQKNKLFLSISSTLAKEIKLSVGWDLLTLECEGKRGQHIEVAINGKSYVLLKVLFCSSAIMDCERRSKSESFNFNYTIKYTLNQTEYQKGTAEFRLPHPSVEPKLKCMVSSFKYEAKNVETILQISNNSVLHYAPSACIKITGYKLFDPSGTIIIPNAVEVKLEHASAPNPYSRNDTNIIAKGEQMQLINSKNEIEAIHPENGYHIDVPLSIDLNKISNPEQEKDTYLLDIEYEYWDTIHTSPRRKDQKRFKIDILKNKERIGLGVNLLVKSGSSDDEYRNLAVLSGTTRVDQPIEVNQGKGHRTYLISIQNTATIVQSEQHPDAGIIIKDFSCSGIVFKDGVIARDSDDKKINLTDICNVNSYSGPEKVLLPKGKIDIVIPFNKGTKADHFLDASNKKIFKAETEIKVSFDYYIDETGNRDFATLSKQHFEGSVIFTLSIMPGRKWLCIDFGSSAVVALYGNAINLDDAQGQNCIQNLKKIKVLGLIEAYKEQGKTFQSYQTVTDEDVFINSRIVLGEEFPKGEVVTDFSTYPKGIIRFSPGDGFDYTKLLPSLKSMMGYEHIPRKMQSPPLVNDIYEMAYQQLFNLYLSKISPNTQKIVMTYPNTFAAEHVEKLKKLAKQCLGMDRDDYIVTVSESDAVAYRYLMLRKQLLGPVGNDIDRNVLIYDMGAGTLDITYFSNIEENGLRKVDIKGRFGISKAGNYLDYVLAEIVVDICKKYDLQDANGEHFESYLSIESNRTESIDTCFTLKNYVKNELKPLLAEIVDINIDNDAKMPKWSGILNGSIESVKLSEVYQSKKFDAFIKDISKNVIEGCDRLFVGGLKNVNVVVFSGRMTSMECIRKAVMSEIRKKTQDAVIPIDIAKSQARGKAQLQERKTAVVEGALNYAESFKAEIENEDPKKKGLVLLPPKPFFAHYCVIAKRLHRDSEVIDLVDNSMEAEKYTSTSNIDLSDVYALYLIQTYAVGEKAILQDFEGDKDTDAQTSGQSEKADFESGRIHPIGERNLTTILAVSDTSNLTGNFKVKVQCQGGDRHKQGTKPVSLWVGDDEIEANPHDNISSTAFRKSAWPIVF